MILVRKWIKVTFSVRAWIKMIGKEIEMNDVKILLKKVVDQSSQVENLYHIKSCSLNCFHNISKWIKISTPHMIQIHSPLLTRSLNSIWYPTSCDRERLHWTWVTTHVKGEKMTYRIKDHLSTNFVVPSSSSSSSNGSNTFPVQSCGFISKR